MSENPQVARVERGRGLGVGDLCRSLRRDAEPLGEAALQRLNVQPGSGSSTSGAVLARPRCGLAASAAPAAVLGVDLSKPMLGLATRRAAAAGLTNVTFAEHDVEAMSFGDGIFEAAYSRFGVMFFADPVRAFTHVRESLVRGGRLAFVCFPVAVRQPVHPRADDGGSTDPKDEPADVADGTKPVRVRRPDARDGDSDKRRLRVRRDSARARRQLCSAPPTICPAMALRLIEQNPALAALFDVATAGCSVPRQSPRRLRHSAPHVVDGMVTLAAGNLDRHRHERLTSRAVGVEEAFEDEVGESGRWSSPLSAASTSGPTRVCVTRRGSRPAGT